MRTVHQISHPNNGQGYRRGSKLTLRGFISYTNTRLLHRLVGVPYRTLWFVAFCLAVLPFYVRGQAQNPSKPEQNDDVIRINTELVQTDVMVFDKKGHFADGLRPEQFSLSLDGQTRS